MDFVCPLCVQAKTSEGSSLKERVSQHSDNKSPGVRRASSGSHAARPSGQKRKSDVCHIVPYYFLTSFVFVISLILLQIVAESPRKKQHSASLKAVHFEKVGLALPVENNRDENPNSFSQNSTKKIIKIGLNGLRQRVQEAFATVFQSFAGPQAPERVVAPDNCSDANLYDAHTLAAEVEEALYDYIFGHRPSTSGLETKYKQRFQSLLFNMKDPAARTLRSQLMYGALTSYDMVRMSSQELASGQMAAVIEEAKRQLAMDEPVLDLETRSKLGLVKRDESEEKRRTVSPTSVTDSVLEHSSSKEHDELTTAPFLSSLDAVFLKNEAGATDATPAVSEVAAEGVAEMVGGSHEANIRVSQDVLSFEQFSHATTMPGVQPLVAERSTAPEDGTDSDRTVPTPTVASPRAVDGADAALGQPPLTVHSTCDTHLTTTSPSAWSGAVFAPGIMEGHVCVKGSTIVGPASIDNPAFWTDALAPCVVADARDPDDGRLKIIGRAEKRTIVNYLTQLRTSTSRDVFAMALEATPESRASYQQLFKYHATRQTCAVLEVTKAVVHGGEAYTQDCYLFPLMRMVPIPPFLRNEYFGHCASDSRMEWIDNENTLTADQDVLLLVAVRHRGRRSGAPATPKDPELVSGNTTSAGTPVSDVAPGTSTDPSGAYERIMALVTSTTTNVTTPDTGASSLPTSIASVLQKLQQVKAQVEPKPTLSHLLSSMSSSGGVVSAYPPTYQPTSYNYSQSQTAAETFTPSFNPIYELGICALRYPHVIHSHVGPSKFAAVCTSTSNSTIVRLQQLP